MERSAVVISTEAVMSRDVGTTYLLVIGLHVGISGPARNAVTTKGVKL